MRTNSQRRRYARPRLEHLESRELLDASAICRVSGIVSACGDRSARLGDAYELSIELQPSATEVDSIVVDWGDGRVDELGVDLGVALHPFGAVGVRNISVVAKSGEQAVNSVVVPIDVVAGSQPVIHRGAQGLRTQLYANVSPTSAALPTGPADHERIDPTIHFDFGSDAPDPVLSSSNYGIRWTGTIAPSVSALHTFFASTGEHDSLRVWIDGNLVIDSWNAPSGELLHGERSLMADVSVPIVVEFRAGIGRSKVELTWESPLTLNERIPSDRLTAAAGLLPHGVLWEEWNGGGTKIVNLTTHAAFVSNLPNTRHLEQELQVNRAAPAATGQRGRALLSPPESGYYQFLLSGDSTAELWLAHGIASSNADRIANVTVATAYQQFDVDPSQTSDPIFLAQGEMYYVEVLQKSDATSPSHASVAWIKPGATTYEIIPSSALQPVRPVVKLHADNSSTNEADGLAGGVTFTVTRSDDLGHDLVVGYTIGGSAENGLDYALLSGNVTIPKGHDSAVIDIVPIDDGVLEGAENVVIRLVADDSYWLGTESEIQAVATIQGEEIAGTVLLGSEGVLLINTDFVVGSSFSNTTTSSASVPFTDVLQVDVGTVTNTHDVQSGWVLDGAISKNDVLSLSGYLRSTNANSSPVDAEVRFESNIDFFGDSQRLTAGSEWTRFFVTFEAPRDYQAGELRVGTRFGFSNQSVQLGGVELTSYDRIVERQSLADEAILLQNVSARIGDATYENVAVAASNVPFNQALRVNVDSFVNPWDVRPVWDLESRITKNAPVTVRGYIRSANSDGSDVVAEARIEQKFAPYSGLSWPLVATSAWQLFEFTFNSPLDFDVAMSSFDVRLGYDQQVVDIAAVSVSSMEYPLGLLPSEKNSYVDREASSIWRAQAESAIALHRTNNLRIDVVNEYGQAVEDAVVTVEMLRPEFELGSTIYQEWFSPTLGEEFNSSVGERYRSTTASLFQRAVDSGAMQWIEWLRNPAGAIEDAQWANDAGLRLKGHSIIWGALNEYPSPTAEVGFDLAGSYHAVLNAQGAVAAKQWMQQALLNYVNNGAAFGLNGLVPGTVLPIISEWDVINHPLDYPAIWNIVGDDFMVDVIQAARLVVNPSTDLFINENGIVNTESADRLNAVLALVNDLLNNGAAIDGVGLQSHFHSEQLPSMSSIQSKLGQMGQLDLKLHVSEFDVDSVYVDAQTQADFTRDYLLAALSEPALEAFYFWGFWEGHQWRASEHAELVDREFKVRPNGQVLLDYLHETFAKHTATGSQVDYSGMAGSYRVSVRHGDDIESVQGVTMSEPTTALRVVVPAPGLVTHWDFDIDANDQAPFGTKRDDGTLVGASLTAGGLGANAAKFGGNGDMITLPTSSDINQSFAAKTVSLWIYPSDLANSDRQVIYEQGGTGRGMNIYLDGGDLVAGAWNDSTSWNGSWLSSGNVAQNQWSHVALVLDAASDQIELFVNGVSVGTAFGTSMHGHNPVVLGGVLQGTRFDDGQSGFVNSVAMSSFEGLIDEVRIYDRSLSGHDIESLSAITLVDVIDLESKLVAYWDFEGNSNDIAVEGAVVDNGTLIGAAIVSGGVGMNALTFGAAGDAMTLATSADINSAFTQKTVALWFNPVNASGANRQVIYQQGGTVRGMNIYLENGSLYAGAWDDSGWGGKWLSSSNVTSNQWNQVVVTFDSVNGQLQLVVNGTATQVGTIGSLSGHNPATLGSVRLGTRFADGFGGSIASGALSSYAGDIDDVRIYGRVLTTAEIDALPRV